jgi:prolyl oligopeptidase
VINAKVISHDGTAIPLTTIGPRGVARDGANIVYLVGYGSYGTSMDPLFDPLVLAWCENGGIVAVDHARGGEYGEEWHRAGQKATKANTAKDFFACAEYLIRERYTRPGRLAGAGVSAGGILIGRAITERPDLFRAALIGAGPTDMLRAEFQKNGAVNIPEFGTVKNGEDFPALLGMSAYHHVKNGVQYPAVLGDERPRLGSLAAGEDGCSSASGYGKRTTGTLARRPCRSRPIGRYQVAVVRAASRSARVSVVATSRSLNVQWR